MRLLKNAVLPLAAIAVLTSFAFAKVSLDGVKCLIAGSKDVQESKSAEWKEGKVYFCCGNCLGKFNKMSDEDKEKMAPKANAQLVASGQYVQKACPISGQDIDAEKSLEVAGTKVSFCCGNCLAKAKGWEGDEQVENLFGEKAFKTAKYEVVKAEDE